MTQAPDHSIDEPDYARRFGGVARLYGQDAVLRLQQAHVAVVGVGGVGSWAVEGLARSGLGQITLIDLDHIAESNINRQLPALDNTLGMAKVAALKQRLCAINPACQVHAIEEFVSADNVAALIPANVEVVIDAVDDVAAKLAMVLYCRQQGIHLVTTGAAGGRTDPSRIQCQDLAWVQGDRLLAKLRNQLRRDHGYPKGVNGGKSKPKPMGITAIYSDEAAILPASPCETDAGITGLHCAGYGSSVCVTAPFGFMAAAQALAWILKRKTDHRKTEHIVK